jgi:hypothetical protein
MAPVQYANTPSCLQCYAFAPPFLFIPVTRLTTHPARGHVSTLSVMVDACQEANAQLRRTVQDFSTFPTLAPSLWASAMAVAAHVLLPQAAWRDPSTAHHMHHSVLRAICRPGGQFHVTIRRQS